MPSLKDGAGKGTSFFRLVNKDSALRVAHVITRMIIGGAQENTLLNCLDLVREYSDDVVLITGPSLGPEGDLLSQGRAEDLEVRRVDSLQRAIHPRDGIAASELRQELRRFQARRRSHPQRQGWPVGPLRRMGRTCSRHCSFSPWSAVSSLSIVSRPELF